MYNVSINFDARSENKSLAQKILNPSNRTNGIHIAIILALLGMISPAWSQNQGQGFMIKPTKLEMSARGGQSVERIVEIRNTADETKTLDLQLIELSQSRDGGWLIVEPGDTSVPPFPYSCTKWAKVSANTVTVDAQHMTPVTVSLSPPARARGFYAAGLLVTAKPKPGSGAVTVVIRFMIPILLEIEGWPERQQIQLAETGLAVRKEDAKLPASTLASLDVANDGRTCSHIKGSVKIQYFSNGHWKAVATAETRNMGMLPGTAFHLDLDLKRRLPAGMYKLTALLAVDGRRAKTLEKDIEFEGDPATTRLAADMALTLEPSEISIACAPGASRTSVVKVVNTSDEEVEIDMTALMPPSLKSVAVGDLKGDDLSCADWLEVTPSKFTLRANGKQNVRITAKMPRTETQQANYYGLVSLRAAYPDGQSAGETKSLINVTNKGVAAKPAAQVAKMSLAATDGSKYAVQVHCGNVGNVHFIPKLRAVIVTTLDRTVAETELVSDGGLLIPMQNRDFSGVLDFDKIEPGSYSINATLDAGTSVLGTQSLPIKVTLIGDKKVVSILSEDEVKSAAALDANPGVKP